MNRLSPLIVRQPAARIRASAAPRAAAPDEAAEKALDDLKLFATGWVGGLIFFGTLLS